jgi:23S rRNA (uracil1939-C5)-methyltransferase
MTVSKTVFIERLAYGGAGVGRLDGKVCFVSGAAPGDQLLVSVHANKRSYCEATIAKIVSPGSGRIIPPCPIFGQCGGCQWQHIEYEEQLRAKEAIFSQAFSRARVEVDHIAPIIPSSFQYGYRYRVQVKICWVQSRLIFGFYRTGTHHVVEFPPDGCLLAVPILNQALTEVRTVFSKFPDPQSIPKLDLAVGDDGGVLAILHYLGTASESVATFLIQQRDSMPAIAGMFLQLEKKHSIQRIYGTEHVQYHVPSGVADHDTCLLQVSRGGFSQINLPQNRRLVTEVFALMKPHPTDRILDLFCGNGNFSIPLALAGAIVVGMDDYGGSIRDAMTNAHNAGVDVDYRTCDAHRAVQSLLGHQERFTAMLLDPPRAGARDISSVVHGLGMEYIVYVSCDPMTLTRDLAIILNNGYSVKFTRVIDLFPQTYHMESVTLLKRN